MSSKKTRKLKVYYAYHGYSPNQHPFIRLAGKYLMAFGFKIGDEVDVEIEVNRIVISKRQANEMKALD